ncbi:MAG TPA: hypothetical protein VF337_09395 [Candidatus Limnocylindrales bacterium]
MGHGVGQAMDKGNSRSTPAQIQSATGKSTSNFDFVMQVDLDKDGTYAALNGGFVEGGRRGRPAAIVGA